MIRQFWLVLLIFIPIIPKVEVLSLGGVSILLDDFCLFAAALLGVVGLLLKASISGSLRVSYFQVTSLLGLFVLYKTVNFAVLSLIYPWTDLSGIGKGVLFSEGILVLAKTGIFFVVFYLFSSEIRSIKAVETVLRLFMVSIIAVVGVGLVQYIILEHPILTSTFRNIHALSQRTSVWGVEDPWFDASATGHEQLGAFMIIAISLLGGLLLTSKTDDTRWKLVILLGGCIFVLILASSRGAWIGAACSLLVFIWLSVKRNNLSGLLVLGGFICCGLYVLEFVFDVSLIDYVYSRTRDLIPIWSGEVKDNSAVLRLITFKILWGAFENSMLIGWGAGGAGRIAEGQYIRELVEGGLIGITIWVYLIAKSSQVAMATYRLSADPRIKGVCIGFFCGLVGLCGQALFTELLVITKVAVPFWILAAIVHRYYSLELQEKRTQ